ncbi:hypothetical protein BJ508DRAFT_30108 [Ascobolus immersus RN42]|uniref:Cation/H+ exchanger domain-containing protein n=1 Tax=Ascobolus immersus RN42 TaxID=1160509 RepID=A0A3N4HN99_ASCIM|nr:hypothetical protein BJ508DRAFT_30108 [Ascobolus immersus RN42]
MLCSLFVKERLYIGEATVATLCGVIVGPYSLKWFDPSSWGNVDQITLECSRILLVVQCFAVGVELPKKYMNRHWKSVVLLLLPVMTFGWLVTSLVIWWMIPTLSFVESLCCGACVTATDPVLASSVVGKGKFAKRIPKHLRDLLSAESGCNDGMAFPFIYLGLYLIQYHNDAAHVTQHWIVNTILYECVFGAIYGVAIGYIGRRLIRAAEAKELIDRESFLVFYFVLALFCAGTGSMLGLDDLLVGFCAGVGFSNDGWFTEKTEESHVSNVIDLLLNLAYFVYFGAIIPWKHYNAPEWGITPWRLVVIALFVIFFRRIPIMLALKPVIPDIKTWREALFAGHFGPIGVGAIFVAILARAELETGEPTPLAVLPPPGSANYVLIEVIWPITTFLVISSIIVHGSSIAVFTLGKRINTMTISMSYTVGNDENGWLSRLPKLNPSLSKSFRKPEHESETSDEKLPQNDSDGTLSPGREEGGSGATSPRRMDGLGRPTGRKIVFPDEKIEREKQEGEYGDPRMDEDVNHEDDITAFQEGRQVVFEDRQGEVIGQTRTGPERQLPHGLQRLSSRIRSDHGEDVEQMPTPPQSALLARTTSPHDVGPIFPVQVEEPTATGTRSRKAATAYRFDDTIILEDEDGEVIKRYRIPRAKPYGADKLRRRRKTKPSTFSARVADWLGLQSSPPKDLERSETTDSAYPQSEYDYDGIISEVSDNDMVENEKDGKKRRFRMHDDQGRNLTTKEFLEKLKHMDAHARDTTLRRGDSNAGEGSSRIPQAAIGSAVATPQDGGSMRKRTSPRARETANSSSTTSPSNPATTPSITISEPRRGSVINSNAPGAPSAGRIGDETEVERKRREAALGITREESESEDEEQTPRRRGIAWAEGTGKGKGRE